jgi:hypothetical protein
MQQLHYERTYWLTQAERRRAICLVSVIVVLLTISALLWWSYR